jgi:putative hydrolase of the HAD superfamily
LKYQAVIFDLFDTLFYAVSLQEYQGMLTEMTSALSINPDIFKRLWTETADARMKGVFRNYQANIEYIYRQIGATIDETRMLLATKIRLAMVRNAAVPRSDAVAVISKLKSEGYKIGLISNCSHEAIEIWDTTPFPTLFDATIFSCLVGVTKPDLLIYQLALQQLYVEPRNCIYIGDGSDRELTGARQAGMQAALLQIPSENKSNVYRVNSEDWDGIVITSLNEVLDLVK